MTIMQIYGIHFVFIVPQCHRKLLICFSTFNTRSLGCILYELLVGSPPFCTTSLLQLIRKIRYETVPWPTNLSPGCLNLLQGLLEKDPRRRLSWPHLLEHPFLENKVLLPPEKRMFSHSVPHLVKGDNEFYLYDFTFSSKTSTSVNDCIDCLAGASQRDSKTRSIAEDAIQKQVKTTIF